MSTDRFYPILGRLGSGLLLMLAATSLRYIEAGSASAILCIPGSLLLFESICLIAQKLSYAKLKCSPPASNNSSSLSGLLSLVIINSRNGSFDCRS